MVFYKIINVIMHFQNRHSGYKKDFDLFSIKKEESLFYATYLISRALPLALKVAAIRG